MKIFNNLHQETEVNHCKIIYNPTKRGEQYSLHPLVYGYLYVFFGVMKQYSHNSKFQISATFGLYTISGRLHLKRKLMFLSMGGGRNKIK